MGMDIYGTNPTSEDGDYFRANIWSWPPILGLIDTANQAFNLNFDTSEWGMNEGKGLDSQEECDLLANAMQRLLDGAESPVITAEHSPMAEAMVAIFGDIRGVKPQAEASRDHAQEFINFLRGCGGFRIC